MSMNRQNNTSTPCSTSTPTQNQSSNQTSEIQDDDKWPRFLIMEAADKNIPFDLNAFVLKKAIDGMANAELDNVKPMKSGRVFIEVEARQQCKNLLKTTKLLGYLPVKVSPHRTLNSSKFVIKCEELDKMQGSTLTRARPGKCFFFRPWNSLLPWASWSACGALKTKELPVTVSAHVIH